MPRVKDTGYVNPQEVYNYLVNVKGLSREHALGMLSNIQAESGFKIAVQEYGKPQGSGGIGLFQHTGPRRQALIKYTGGDVNDWTKQVDFALQEGVTKNYLAQKFETPEEASIWFTTKWERPANATQRAQERLKYLNKYSSFTGYESSYQPSPTFSSQDGSQIAQQGVAQMPIPFEVVVAGKPQQVAFTYEDFQKALATTKKAEEKEQESEARQELQQEMTTQEAFLKAMESITLPSAEPRGSQQKQQFATPGTTGYEPLPIQEVSVALPQLPNIFSTQLPEMQDGGKVYSVKGEKFYKGPDGNWYRGESMNPQQRIYDKGTLNYINTNAVSSTPTNQGPQGAPKTSTLKSTNAVAPQINQKIYPGNPANFSETTQSVAAKTTPQTAEQRANVEGARQDIAQRKANIEKVLITQGKTPEQAASIVGSYGSEWTTLENTYARELDTMTRRAESIQSGNTPDKMAEYIPRPEQSDLGFARDVLFNPFTAAGYAIRGQEIPDYMGEKIDNGTLGYWSNGQFIQGRNLLDTAVDVATPIGWAHSGYNITERGLNDKSGDFWTEENAWDALNVLPGVSLAAKGMKYVPLSGRVKFAPRSITTNLAVDAGNIVREPIYAPQRPSFLNPSISQRETEFYNPLSNPETPQINPRTGLLQINNTTMLSSPIPDGFVRSQSGEFKSMEGLPEYMNPYLYSKEVMDTRMSPQMQAYYQMQKVEKAADRIIKRTTDDKVYYDIEGNVIKTPLDNQRKGGQISAQDTKEMLEGIADILRQVNDVENRKAIAKNMIGDFNREGLDYDLNNFLRSSQVKMQEGGSPTKPPKFSFNYNPYVYNPNELTGYRGYGDLSGTSLGISTPDLLGREKKVDALKVPFIASVNRLYDTNVQNTTTEYSDIQQFNQDLSPEYLQAAAQQQLASASQPYADKSPIGFNIQTGVYGSGINPNIKKRTRIDAIVSAGYNPLSGLNAGVNSKFAFAFGNDFYRPLKNTGDWRVVGNIQPFGMSINQQRGYSSQDAIVQANLEQMAETGTFADATQNNYGYDPTKPGLGSPVQVTSGAGIDGSVKLPIGMLNAGAGVKYNRAAGEEERLAPTAYVGYSISGAELSKLGNKLPQINLPSLSRSNYETLASQDLEDQKGEWIQGPDGKFVWRDFPGFNGAVNASTFEGEDIYVPSTVINQRNGGVVQTFPLF